MYLLLLSPRQSRQSLSYAHRRTLVIWEMICPMLWQLPPFFHLSAWEYLDWLSIIWTLYFRIQNPCHHLKQTDLWTTSNFIFVSVRTSLECDFVMLPKFSLWENHQWLCHEQIWKLPFLIPAPFVSIVDHKSPLNFLCPWPFGHISHGVSISWTSLTLLSLSAL